jgi:hypothetical protein
MADKQRRQLIVLGVLGAALALVLGWQFRPAARGPTRTTPGPVAGGPVVLGAGRAPAPPPDLRFDALDTSRPVPAETGRNPFRFRAAAPPASRLPGGEGAPTPPIVTERSPEPVVPPGPPPPQPVPYKFIGMVSASSTGGKVAVLSDGKFVYYGREGDIIEGRYRLVKIGEESLQIEHLDGRGRQTLRMSGS